MKCEEFELLLADALGDELSENGQVVLDRHLATCPACRCDYESAMRTVDGMRSIPGSKSVRMRREGRRWIVDDTHADGVTPPTRSAPRTQGYGVFRWAASILIAFTTGYAFHAGVMMKGAIERFEPTPMMVDVDGSVNVYGALLRAHAVKPSRANLAKALMVLGKSRR